MSTKLLLPVLAAGLLGSAVPALAQQDFPDGAGKETVTAICGGCHDINRVKAGYTPAGWHMVLHMMQNMEAPIPKDQLETVTEYLIKSFPEKPKPVAVVIPGPVEVAIKEWPVPTLGSRPHDPAAP